MLTTTTMKTLTTSARYDDDEGMARWLLVAQSRSFSIRLVVVRFRVSALLFPLVLCDSTQSGGSVFGVLLLYSEILFGPLYVYLLFLLLVIILASIMV